MKEQEVKDTVKKIKRSFFLQMNGVASQSMREKGVNSYVNWGIQLPALKNIAKEYDADYELAIELWKENVRECKILATLLMPHNRMSVDLMSVWIEQTQTLEIAEYAAFNIYQYAENASICAFQWIASDDTLKQVCGYNILSCLFKKKCEPTSRDVNELIDQALSAMSDETVAVRHAAMNCLQVFSSLGEMQFKVVDAALKKCT